MAKFINDKEIIEEEPKPPYKITVNFAGYQNLDLIAHNIDDAFKKMEEIRTIAKNMGLELEFDDPEFEWLNGQSPPESFFDKTQEAPNKLQKDKNLK